MTGLRTWSAAVGILALFAPSTRAQAVAFFPNVVSFPNGVTMSATPVVSADRRYVRLGMAPQFTAIEGFDTFSVPAAVTGGGGNGGGLGGFAGLNGPMLGGAGLSAGDGFGGQGAPFGFGGAAPGQAGIASGDFEDHPWPHATAAPRVLPRPLAGRSATKAARKVRGRARPQRSAAAGSATATPAPAASGLIARERFSTSPSRSQKK